jgi:hypothetical protein
MFIKDEFDKLCLVMPRGSTKTTTVNFALSCFNHDYQLIKYTVVAGKKVDGYMMKIRFLILLGQR